MNASSESIIEINDLKLHIGHAWVHNGINLTVNRGEIFGIVGGSGAGKSLLLRQMLGLQKSTSGTIKIMGHVIQHLLPEELHDLRERWGVLFQHSALFSSLTVLENVAFPLHEHSKLSNKAINELATLKVLATDLPLDTINKYPAELSGGMRKRAALARAIALDPELLFLDEPTTGLDPHTASVLDELVLSLRSTLELTIVMVTHDLDSLWHIVDRVAFLGEGKILCVGSMHELLKSNNPLIQEYFKGPRGRATAEIYEKEVKS